MPIDSQNLAKLLEWLHGFDKHTLNEIRTVLDGVIAEREGKPRPVANKSDKLNASSPMPFGKFRGTPLKDVDTSYLRWLWNQRPIKASPALEEYLRGLFTVTEGIDDEQLPD